MSPIYRERPAAGDPEDLLILHPARTPPAEVEVPDE